MQLDPNTTALVLIDLQAGIVGQTGLAPRSGDSVVATGTMLADRFRAAAAPVVLVNVAFGPGMAEAPSANVDSPIKLPVGGLPDSWSALMPGLAQPGDLCVTKRNWGAFHGTELDTILRRRGIRTVVVGGIATNFGVEGTAREAWQHGYDVIVAEDATTSVAADLHEMAIRFILPRLARVRPSSAIELAANS